MQDSGMNEKEYAEEVEELRSRKGKLERVSRSTTERKKAAEKPRESEERLSAIIYKSPIPTAVGGSDGSIIAFNEAMETLIGYKKSEISDVADWANKLYPDKEYREFVWKNIKQALDGRKQDCTEFTITCKDGSTRAADFHISFFEGGLVIQAVDITEQKRVEEEKEKLLKAIEITLEAICITSPDTVIIYANDAMHELFGYEKGKLIGKHVSVLNAGSLQKARELPKHITNTVRKTGLWEGEIHNKRKDGKEFISYARISAVRDKDGKILNFVSTKHDITERKREAEALRKTEEERKIILNTMSELVAYQDMKHRLLWANRAAAESVGLAVEDLVGRSCYEIWHGGCEPCAGCPVEKAWKSGQLETGEIAGTDGRVWSIRVNPVKDIKGGVTGVVEIVQDITERKRAQEALRESEERFRSLYDNALVGLYRTTPDGRILMANPALVRMLGYSSFDELKQRNLEEEGFEGRYPRSVFKERIEADGQVIGLESAWHTRDGRTLFVLESAQTFRDKAGNALYYEGTIQDITERKRSEEALRESEEKFRGIFENANDAIIYLDESGKILDVNDKAVKVFGGLSEGILGRHFTELDVYQPEERARLSSNFEGILNGQETRPTITVRNKQGREIILECSSSLLKSGGGDDKIMVIARDITERKRAEESVRKERDISQKYLDIAGVMFVAINTEGEVVLINKKGCEVLGYDHADIIGKKWFENFIPQRIREEIMLVSGKLLKGEIELAEYHENPVLTKSGEERIIAWHNTILTDEEGNIIGHLSSGEDITGRKRAEAEVLMDREKLKSLASELTVAEERERRRIASEIHDVTIQSLALAKMKLDGLSHSVSLRDPAEVLDEVRGALGKAIDETRSLVSRVHSPILALLGFEAAVGEWLTGQIQEKHGIECRFEDDGQPKPLDDDVQLILFRDVRELLMNVVKHARAKKVKVSIGRDGEQICVGVEDDGVGFDSAEAATTVHKRDEFGLFSIRERLEEMGGHLEIRSHLGHGTRIAMTAPLKQREVDNGRN